MRNGVLPNAACDGVVLLHSIGGEPALEHAVAVRRVLWRLVLPLGRRRRRVALQDVGRRRFYSAGTRGRLCLYAPRGHDDVDVGRRAPRGRRGAVLAQERRRARARRGQRRGDDGLDCAAWRRRRGFLREELLLEGPDLFLELELRRALGQLRQHGLELRALRVLQAPQLVRDDGALVLYRCWCDGDRLVIVWRRRDWRERRRVGGELLFRGHADAVQRL